MFALRGIVVSFAFFALLYCLLSLLVASTWRGVRMLHGISAQNRAHLLFALRILPLVASAAVTLALALPSFLLLESDLVDEDLGTFTLSLCALLLMSAALIRVVRAKTKTSRVVANWLDGANALEVEAPAPAFQSNRCMPPLTLAGIRAPKVLVSEAAVTVLSPDELKIAVQHEVEHIRSRDNLKKLIFYCSPFPGMTSLESAWQEAAEHAADDGAVSSLRNALDLAAALIKLSRLVPVYASPAFTMELVNSSGAVSVRVERLLAWNKTQHHVSRVYWWYAVPALFGILLCGAATCGPVLAQTHRLTEWLIR